MQTFEQAGYFPVTMDPDLKTFVTSVLDRMVDFTAVSTAAFLNPAAPNFKACCLTKSNSTFRIQTPLLTPMYGHSVSVTTFVRNILLFFAVGWRQFSANVPGGRVARISFFARFKQGGAVPTAPPMTDATARTIAACNGKADSAAFVEAIRSGERRHRLSVGKQPISVWKPVAGAGNNHATYKSLCGHDGTRIAGTKKTRPLCLTRSHWVAVFAERADGTLRPCRGKPRCKAFTPGSRAARGTKRARAAKGAKSAVGLKMLDQAVLGAQAAAAAGASPVTDADAGVGVGADADADADAGDPIDEDMHSGGEEEEEEAEADGGSGGEEEEEEEDESESESEGEGESESRAEEHAPHTKRRRL
jgi:hypothetical protein